MSSEATQGRPRDYSVEIHAFYERLWFYDQIVLDASRA